MYQSYNGAGGIVIKKRSLKSSLFTIETLYIYAANVIRHYQVAYQDVLSLIQGLAGNEMLVLNYIYDLYFDPFEAYINDCWNCLPN